MRSVTQPEWKTTEDRLLREHFLKRGAKWCSQQLTGRSKDAVYARVRKIGIARKREDLVIQTSPQIDALIRFGYGQDRSHGFRNRLAKRIGRPAWWISQRSIDLGLMPARDNRPWGKEEYAFAESRPLVSAAALSKQMRARGWKRTPVAISNMRHHGLLAKDDPAWFSAAGLAQAMGVDRAVVAKWIKQGWLTAKPRGTSRTEAQGGDTYLIHEREVAAFVVAYVAQISLAKIEPNKAWFVDLMARCAAPAGASSTDRDKRRRIVSLACSRPDLSVGQIAEMVDSTSRSVSATLSSHRRQERERAAA